MSSEAVFFWPQGGQAELGRWLTERLGRSIDRAAVNKMLKTDGTARKIAADEMMAIAEITKFPPPLPDAEVEEATVQLVGYVAAGAQMILFDSGQGPFGRVPAPENSTEKTVAVEIRGESLGALFDRWLVYYDDVRSPVTSDLIGKLCVIGLNDGRVMIKLLKRSKTKGRFNLLANEDGESVMDAKVEWAAKVNQMTPR